MADGSDDGSGEGVLFKRSSRGCASYSTAAPDGSVRRDGTGLCRRAAGEKLQDGTRHAHGEFAVLFRAAHVLALALGSPLVGVPEAFFFRAVERSLLDQDALAFVAVP